MEQQEAYLFPTVPEIGGFPDPDSGSEPAESEISFLHLGTSASVLAALSKIDWAFTDEVTQVAGHDVHPYPAKFIPQIPGHLISRLSGRGELVLDPFGGSGTTALEAVRLGRRALSIDANPLSALIGRVKTARIDSASLNELHALHGLLSAELQGGDLDSAALIQRWSKAAPDIPNREKWFSDSAFGELLLIRSRINELEAGVTKDIALVALSRMVLQASFQDSETRYKSVPRHVPVGDTLRRYVREFRAVIASVSQNRAVTRFGISDFICSDIRTFGVDVAPDGIADLIVTSPPYGNATDYHLYHRFRLLWLGFDPKTLARIEIGSHLKHQREGSGYSSYLDDMELALATMARLLKPSRFAALVVGDSVYEGVCHDPASALAERAQAHGFEPCGIIPRSIHATKRSFVHAGRRATIEHLLILRNRDRSSTITLYPPPYKLWPYEAQLRVREAGLDGGISGDGPLTIQSKTAEQAHLKRLVFTHSTSIDGLAIEPTWQAILENGSATEIGTRKDPKYTTHGIHAYKGKFYPQLAKALLNLSGVEAGAKVLDPFCGSGTTLLEGFLNGYEAYGLDMNPLAAKIARAKVSILTVEPDLLVEVINTVEGIVGSPPAVFPDGLREITEPCLDELERWFAAPVVRKLDWLLFKLRRASAGPALDFLETVVSSIIREVSQQDPADLRIRYRSPLLRDADVLGRFLIQLRSQFERIEKFWTITGHSPHRFRPAVALEGDNRVIRDYARLGLSESSVDLILTSPPYATALPYIDTDRLSMLVIMGLTSTDRKPIESGLIGSREIGPVERRAFETADRAIDLPPKSRKFLNTIRKAVAADSSAGFRKKNSPALLARYLLDMQAALANAYRVAKPGADAMIVIGDSRTELNGQNMRIPTTALIEELCEVQGFERVERINISVTTENMRHARHAITVNAVLRMRKPRL
jgi:DNA modification methylase